MKTKNRPITTLFMISSVDGKISAGSSDNLDFDKDLLKITGIKEGFHQYYEIEQRTDLYSLNSGKVQAKIGANLEQKDVQKLPVSFLIIDNKPHLDEIGVDNFIRKSKKLFIITNNKNHPAFDRKDEENLEIIYYPDEIDFKDLFGQFKEKYGIERLTIQAGGTLNSIFLRERLIDHISLVIAPALIGGKDTPTLIDGTSLQLENELVNIKALKLQKVETLEDSYIHLLYDVVNDTLVG